MKISHFLATAAFALILPTTTPAIAQDGEKKPEAKKEEGEGEGRRRGRRGGRRGGFGMNPEAMKEQLGLSDEQVKKLNDMRNEMRENFRKMREEGGFDRTKMRELMQGSMKKMQEVLTPEQRAKWEKAMSERRGRGMDRGRRRGDNFKQLRERALKELKLSDEEKAVLVPMLDGVLETRKLLAAESDKRRKTFLEKVRATTGETELAMLLKEYRAAGSQDKETLKKAQAKLVEALTPEQEALLVALNILD